MLIVHSKGSFPKVISHQKERKKEGGWGENILNSGTFTVEIRSNSL